LNRIGAGSWPRDAEILELFCGRGNGLQALDRLGFNRVQGVDSSSSLIAQYKGSAQLFVADCRHLPFVTRSKDIVIIQGGLHHLKTLPYDLEQTLSEAARVLRDTGLFIAIEPWLTPFLIFVHRICECGIARRMVPKIDALATMIEHERDTYAQWLRQPQTIQRIFDRLFLPVSSSIRFGKHVYVGHKKLHSLQL
jgi:ubiquinone/menaquinone biosynthesis C-methylase UbiE